MTGHSFSISYYNLILQKDGPKSLTNSPQLFPAGFCDLLVENCDLVPTGSEEREVLGVGNIPVAKLVSI